MITEGKIRASFRDPSGTLFCSGGQVYRHLAHSYKEHYEQLMNSGLYAALVEQRLLIAHEETDEEGLDAFKVIKPELVTFISYPYEWSFSQLKDAALCTLSIQKKALEFGMILKDASAYNVQFVRGAPLFIDTCSFEKYEEGQPWVAYGQFCRHFLAPLALMSYKDLRLNRLFAVNLDGIPLDLAARLLPLRAWLNVPLLLNIFIHAKSQTALARSTEHIGKAKLSRQGLIALMKNLEQAVESLSLPGQPSNWSDYYADNSYSAAALARKKELVSLYLDDIKPELLWDLGSNTGLFSNIAAAKGIETISFDMDPVCVEINYVEARKKGERHVLPLVVDLTNPSPSIGWDNNERKSLVRRGPADAAMALALIHHLAIANNLPFGRIAQFFSGICTSLIIEFVPKGDPQVKRLLASRKDIFTDYSEESFEQAFKAYFRIERKDPVGDSGRTLYLMKR